MSHFTTIGSVILNNLTSDINMNYFKYDIVFQEVPNEISLALYFTGCPLQCHGCHSPELWNKNNGKDLSTKVLKDLIQKYRGSISCLLCMGGEWEPIFLLNILKIAKNEKLKTALYTGRELIELPTEIINHLDYLKTGPWIEELGGLNSNNTNQKFFKFSEHIKEDKYVFKTHTRSDQLKSRLC